MVSFSAGALFGDVFIHLLPEVINDVGFGLNVSFYVMFGIAFSFIIEKFIHWRHCHIPNSKDHVKIFFNLAAFNERNNTQTNDNKLTKNTLTKL